MVSNYGEGGGGGLQNGRGGGGTSEVSPLQQYKKGEGRGSFSFPEGGHNILQ